MSVFTDKFEKAPNLLKMSNTWNGDGDDDNDKDGDGDDDALKASMMKWQRLKLRGRHYGNASPGELERCNTDVDFNDQYGDRYEYLDASMVTIKKRNRFHLLERCNMDVNFGPQGAKKC